MYLFNEHNRLSMAVGQPVGYLQGDDDNYNSFWEMQEVIVDHIVSKYKQKKGRLKDLKLMKNEFRDEFLKFLTAKDDNLILQTLGFLTKVIYSKELLSECQLISPQIILDAKINNALKEKLLRTIPDQYIIQNLIKLIRVEENVLRGITLHCIYKFIDLLCYNQTLRLTPPQRDVIMEAHKQSIKCLDQLLKQEKKDNNYYDIFKKEWDKGTNWTKKVIYKAVADPILLLINHEDPDTCKYSPDLAITNDLATAIQTVIQKALLYNLVAHSTRTLGNFPIAATLNDVDYKEGEVIPYKTIKKVTTCIEVVNKKLMERYIIDDDTRFVYIERLPGGMMKVLRCCHFRYIDVCNSNEQTKIKDLVVTIKLPGEPIYSLIIGFDNYQKCGIIKEMIEIKRKQLCDVELMQMVSFFEKLA